MPNPDGPFPDVSSGELYETYRLNRDLIIENNPGAGVMSDVYVNPTFEDGTPKGTAVLDASFLGVEPVDRGIAENKARFLRDTLQVNASRMADLDVGESVVVRDHWDAAVESGHFGSLDYDVFQSLGTATLNSRGTFRVAVVGIGENGSREVRVDYAVDHVLFDHYDWNSDTGLTGTVRLGQSGEAVGPDGEPLGKDRINVEDRQMGDLRAHGARDFPLVGVVRETGSLTGTVSESGGFLSGREASFEPDAGSDRPVREVVTDADYVLPLLEKAVELNGGLENSVPPLTEAQRNNATVIGVDGYADEP